MTESKTTMQKYNEQFDKLRLFAVKNKMDYYEALTKAIKLFLKQKRS